MKLLTEGINGSGPGESSTDAGYARRLRNAQAMQALALSYDPYPALDEDALRAHRIPTILLTGEHTMPIHRATTAALQDLLPQARVRVIPACGHGVHRDNRRSSMKSCWAFCGSGSRFQPEKRPLGRRLGCKRRGHRVLVLTSK